MTPPQLYADGGVFLWCLLLFFIGRIYGEFFTGSSMSKW